MVARDRTGAFEPVVGATRGGVVKGLDADGVGEGLDPAGVVEGRIPVGVFTTAVSSKWMAASSRTWVHGAKMLRSGVDAAHVADRRGEELALADVHDAFLASGIVEANRDLLTPLTVELHQVGKVSLGEIARMRHE